MGHPWWSRLCAPTAEGVAVIPGQGTKIPHTMHCGKKKKKKKMTFMPVTFCTDTNVAGPRGLKWLFPNIPGTHLPQGLCACFFLCLECSPPLIIPSLIFLGSSVKCHLIRDAFRSKIAEVHRPPAPHTHLKILSFLLLGLTLTYVEPESESVTQSCLTLCDPVDCSPPGSSVEEILQARILEW